MIERFKMLEGRFTYGTIVSKSQNQSYRILEHIGKGGFAEVFKAQDLKNEETVALKIIQLDRLNKVRNTNDANFPADV